MKTKIAAFLILIYELFATIFVSRGISSNDCGINPIPPYLTPSLLIASFLLLIAACTLWTKIRRIAWWNCLILAFINLGIMCWGIIYYLGTHCDGPYQITPDTGAAKITIIAAIIIALSLLLLLSDIKHIHHLTTENVKKQTASHLPVAIFVIFIFFFIIMMLFSSVGGTFCSSREAAYSTTREEMRNAVAYYMSDSNNSSQLPIINESATFTLTHPNGSYYIINFSELLISNGGLLREVPDGCIALAGPNNDNCDGGINGCHDTFHYIWGVDNEGNVVSQFINSSEMNICQCNTCDGYQGVWP
ncbi:MAG: hypothetical protein WC562_04085 [Dehalococcoidia bacterium]